MYKYGYCLHAALLHVPQVSFMPICYHPYYIVLSATLQNFKMVISFHSLQFRKVPSKYHCGGITFPCGQSRGTTKKVGACDQGIDKSSILQTKISIIFEMNCWYSTIYKAHKCRFQVAHICLHRDQPQLDSRSDVYIEQAQELVINENILLQVII